MMHRLHFIFIFVWRFLEGDKTTDMFFDGPDDLTHNLRDRPYQILARGRHQANWQTDRSVAIMGPTTNVLPDFVVRNV